METAEFYAEIKNWIADNAENDADSVLDGVCGMLRKDDRFGWVGFYVLSGDHLVLKNFRGEQTEHVRIKLGDGLCSLAILRDDIVNERDVKANTTYLACFPSTRSEIVVPVRWAGRPIGELDVDSDTVNAFDKTDEKFLQEIANLLSARVHSLL